MQALGQTVGLLLGLYVFDEVLKAIMTTLTNSTYFGSAVTFITDLLPVIGILGGFEIIYNTLQRMGVLG